MLSMAACALALLAASCSLQTATPANPWATPRGPAEIEKTYGSPADGTFTVRLSKGSIRAADDLTLEVEARAAAGWTASLPEIADTLGKFSVVDRSAESRRLTSDGALTTSRTYLLEPFLPGAYSIPSFVVTFESEAGLLYSVGSEEIPVEVTSALPPQLGEQDIEDMSGPHTMPSRMALWFSLGGAAILGAAGIGAAALRRRIGARPRAFTARATALAELDRLLGSGLVEKGRHQEFYAAMSDIARRYVEARYQVHAPRRTTEEFLEEAVRHRSLRDHAGLLQGFLTACDLVKFARHTPSAEEVGEAVGACRTFLAASAEKDPEEESPEAEGPAEGKSA